MKVRAGFSEIVGSWCLPVLPKAPGLPVAGNPYCPEGPGTGSFWNQWCLAVEKGLPDGDGFRRKAEPTPACVREEEVGPICQPRFHLSPRQSPAHAFCWWNAARSHE